jgi:hypothetical protein
MDSSKTTRRGRSQVVFSDSPYYRVVESSSDPIREEKENDVIDEVNQLKIVNNDCLVSPIARNNVIKFPFVDRKPLPEPLEATRFVIPSDPLPEQLNTSTNSTSKWYCVSALILHEYMATL